MSEDKPNWHADKDKVLIQSCCRFAIFLFICVLVLHGTFSLGHDWRNKEVNDLKVELNEEVEYSEGLEKAIIKNGVGEWAVNPETGNIDLMIKKAR